MEEQKERVENIELEAKFVANRIKQLIENKFQIYDAKKQEQRDIKYKDKVNNYEIDAPDTYYKEYASCGIGIEKIWGYTVLHLKGHKTFCGRDGYMVNAGIEFKF